MKKQFVAVILCFCFWANAFAAIQFVSVPAGTQGNEPISTTLPYSFDLFFDVNSPITVTSLGAFDSGSDGQFLSTISVVIFDRNTGLAVSPVLEFTSSDNGYAVGGFRYKNLASPLQLPAGFQGAVAAAGYSATGSGYEVFANRSHPNPPSTAFDDGGGLLGGLGPFSYTSSPSPVYLPSVAWSENPPVVATGSFQFAAVPESGLTGVAALGILVLLTLKKSK